MFSQGLLCICLSPSETPLPLTVYIQNLHCHHLTNGDHLTWVVDATPAHISDMKHGHPFPRGLPKDTEIGDIFDNPLDLVADVDRIEECRTLLGALLLDDFTARDNDIFSIVIDLDDLKLKHFAYVFVEISWWNDVNLRTGQESLHSDVDHQAAFDDRLDLGL